MKEKQLITRDGEPDKSKIVELHVLTIFPPPAFPQNYPFSELFQNKRPRKGQKLIKLAGGISKILVDKSREKFVRRIVEQSGFSEIDEDSSIPYLLSDLVEEYLQKFAATFVRNKRSENFSGDKHQYSALETTLRTFGIKGISGLHLFYYENVVKKHDVMQRKVTQMYEDLMKP